MKSSKQKKRGNRYSTVVITIYAKKAFNSASWEATTEELYRMSVLHYLCRILRSYFQNRDLVYETEIE